MEKAKCFWKRILDIVLISAIICFSMALSILYLDAVKTQGMLLLKITSFSFVFVSFFEQHIYSIYA